MLMIGIRRAENGCWWKDVDKRHTRVGWKKMDICTYQNCSQIGEAYEKFVL